MTNKNDFLLLILQQIGRLQRSGQAILRGDDVEALHDFRVALRSLRTLLPLVLLRRKPVDDALLQAWRSLAKLSNAPRDAEVMLSLVGTNLSEAQRQSLQQNYNIGVNHLQTILTSLLLKTLCTNTRLQVQHRLSNINQRQLKHRIQCQQAELCQSLLAANNNAAPKLREWHQRRIIIKQLRYLNELASDWLSPTPIDLLPALKTAQASLGNLQDQFVLKQWLNSANIKKNHRKSAVRDWNKLIHTLKASRSA